jgi:N-acetylglucosamine-6-sulfatase
MLRTGPTLRLLLTLAVVPGLLACSLRVPLGASPARPNIVFFLTDDQRYDQLEYMPVVQRELVSRGINFTNAYVTTPLCCPSRASILTGLYAHNHGVLANTGSHGGWRRFDPGSTIATWLQAAGVRTMLLGKYLNLYRNEGVPPGWDDWFAFWDTGVKYYEYTVNNNGQIRQYGDREQWYSADVLARRATSLLEAHKDRPFFLYLAFDGPHAPAIPARQDRGKFDDLPAPRPPSYNEADVSNKPSWVRRLPPLGPADQQQLDRFWRDQVATLQSIDRAVGAVVEALRADGRLENTWFVLMSDNGLSLGEHRYSEKKTCVYEECVRVPLVIVPPPGRAAEFGAPRTDGRLVLNIDLAPTFAELAGIAPGRAVDGLSLLPLLGDPQAPWHAEGGLELWSEEEQVHFVGLRADQWKYVRYEDGEQELYDLGQDPYELDNLAVRPDQAARLAELSARTTRLVGTSP